LKTPTFPFEAEFKALYCWSLPEIYFICLVDSVNKLDSPDFPFAVFRDAIFVSVGSICACRLPPPFRDACQSAFAQSHWMRLDLALCQSLLAQIPEHDAVIGMGRYLRKFDPKLGEGVSKGRISQKDSECDTNPRPAIRIQKFHYLNWLLGVSGSAFAISL
jgi:hypothetical protein